MWQKIKYYVAGVFAFFVGLAALVSFNRNRAASSAAIKIGEGRESDAAAAQRRETAGEILQRINEKMNEIEKPLPEHTPDTVVIELRRRGHVKE